MIAASKQGKRVNFVWGYGRGSTSRQEITIEHQEEKFRAYFEANRGPGGVFEGMEIGGFLADEGVSGEMTWFERPMGEVLFREMERGDHIVIWKLSRAGRGNIDLLQSMQKLQEAGVTLHSLTERIDLSTATGRFFFSMMAALAQMERETISDQTREALQWKRRQGLPTSGPGAPPGYVKVGLRKESRFVPDNELRRWGYWIAERRDIDKWSFHKIRNELARLNVTVVACAKSVTTANGRKLPAKRGFMGFGTVQGYYIASKLNWPKMYSGELVSKYKHMLAEPR